MAYTKADLELADQHVAQGERHIIQQEELITRLRDRGLPTEEAEGLLRRFQETLRNHRAHRDLICQQVSGQID